MQRLLIANRGEIARRIIRTADRLGIETVAVFSQPDAQALHVREATLAVAIGGRASADSYLRMDRLVPDTCLQFWGGMGFTWENKVSRMYRDGRLASIGGGADEVMLGILAKLMGIAKRPGPQ